MLGRPVDAKPALRPSRLLFHGRCVQLEPLDVNRHGASLWAELNAGADELLWRYLPYGPFTSFEEFRADLQEKEESADPLYFAIVDPSSGNALGHAALMRIEPDHRCIEIGNIVFSPALQRSRAATEAIYLLSRYVFETLHYRRYEWKCDALNARSRRAAQRFGFQLEGIFRQHRIVKGRNRDTAWFSMLDREWPARKASFERWLDPANFDSSGRQIIPLSVLNGMEGETE
jgi:RimJ/RimL family protein N-acetyltransferase